ncbi:hypothetical protein HYT91_02835 [Candidatus Pacearchaeota archaeon]|nr:hypothetical protein [Candidatus Pacearchaeota archaeon]
MAIDDLIFKYENLKIAIPKQLENIFNTIEKSKSLLNLKENWDDEGAKPVNLKAWENSLNFLADYSKEIYRKNKIIINAPEISACGEGSIDLDFRIPYTLLINIKKEKEKIIAGYYGDNYNPKAKTTKRMIEIEGVIEYSPTKIHRPLANWMKKYLRT